MTQADAGQSGATNAIHCPRCGYDQRGVTSTWHESCTLDGICAECGLSFEWADVFDPDRAMPRWCVEAPRGWRRWPDQFILTTLRAWWPRALWSPLRMSHPQVWPRQAGYAFAWMLGLWMLVAGCNGFLACALWNTNMQVGGAPGASTPWPLMLEAMLTPWNARYTDLRTAMIRNWPYLLGILTFPLTTALAFAALPQSRKRAKVQWRHVRRAMVYAIGIAGSIIAFLLIDRALGANDFIWMAMSGRGSSFSKLVLNMSEVTRWLRVPVCAMLPISMLWYWHACARRHMRMENPSAVAISVVVIGGLASCAIGFWTHEMLT